MPNNSSNAEQSPTPANTANTIISIGKRKVIKVMSYAASTVWKFICGNGMASKKELSKVIVSKYSI